MTEKTLKHELYKHGSYLISLKESGSEFVNIDDEIEKVEELFQLASKKDQPAFAVGEYYVSNDGDIYKIALKENLLITVKLYSISSGRFLDMTIPSHDPQDKPATAEQIATFLRAEHFASKGRKFDEFRVGDLVNCSELPFDNGYYTGDVVINGLGKKTFVAQLKNGLHLYNSDDLNKVNLIQTAEELQEVGNDE